MSKIARAESALKAKLEALEDPEWDSNDEEEDEDENKELVQDIVKAGKNGKRRNSNKSQHQRVVANVLYIGHLPTHMEDTELAGFLKQFGAIVRLRVSRSSKTGKSRGYAFVQMKSPDVAAIVADTLSGYLIMGQKRMVCHIVPPEKVHPGLFSISKRARQKLANKNAVPPQTRNLNALKLITSQLVKRERKKREALAKMGIDYDFPGYEASVQKMEQKNKKKRKDSISSVASTESTSKKTKKRKDSVGSVGSAASHGSSKKRKDSIGSVGSSGSEKRRRKSSGADSTPKSKTTTREVATTTKKKKKSKKDKGRRHSSD